MIFFSKKNVCLVKKEGSNRRRDIAAAEI